MFIARSACQAKLMPALMEAAVSGPVLAAPENASGTATLLKTKD
jgi:hypothetical protein